MKIQNRTWKIRQTTWDITKLPGFLEREITNHFGEAQRKNASYRVWTHDIYRGLYRTEVKLNIESGQLRSTTYTYHGLRHVCQFLFLLVPLFVYIGFRSPSAIILLFSTSAYIAVGTLLTVPKEVELKEQLKPDINVEGQTTSVYLPLIAAALISITWIPMRSLFPIPALIIDGIFLILLAHFFLMIIGFDFTGSIGYGENIQYLLIPILGIVWTFLPLVLIYVGFFISSRMQSSGMLRATNVASLTYSGGVAVLVSLGVIGILIFLTMILLVALAMIGLSYELRTTKIWFSTLFLFPTLVILLAALIAIYADFMGFGSIILDILETSGVPLDINSVEALHHVLLINVSLFGLILLRTTAIWVPLLLFAGIFFSLIHSLQRIYNDMELIQGVSSFQTPLQRYSILVGYLAVNLVLATALFLASNIIFETLIDSDLAFNQFFSHEARNVIEQNSETLKILFSNCPFFSPQTYIIAYYIILLSPVLLFLGGWIYSAVFGFGSKVYLRISTEEWDGHSGVVPEHITVRVREGDKYPDIRPVSMFFGIRYFIVVNQIVIDSIGGEELDAILAHEVYHIRNRDVRSTAFASIFGLLVGGRNALLVFYDYPTIEREADEYAAKQVGGRHLIKALERLDMLCERAIKGGGRPLRTIYPGIVGPSSLDLKGSSFPEKLKTGLLVPYSLFFGSIVLDISHRRVDERIAYVRKMSRR